MHYNHLDFNNPDIPDIIFARSDINPDTPKKSSGHVRTKVRTKLNAILRGFPIPPDTAGHPAGHRGHPFGHFPPPLEGRGSVRMSCPKGVSEVSEGAKPNDGIVRKMEKPQ